MVARVLRMADDADIAPVLDAADVALTAELGVGVQVRRRPHHHSARPRRSRVSG
jgi:hypothetical protein